MWERLFDEGSHRRNSVCDATVMVERNRYGELRTYPV
jgi:hypothetical protein